jgi:TonB family protein
MKKIVLILNGILLGIFCFAQKQFSGIYQMESFDKNTYCSVEFHENGCYELELSKNVTSDIIVGLLLSYGRFEIKDSKIILYDDVYKYSMILSVCENKKLKVLEGFCCIMFRNFIYESPSYEYDCMNKPETTYAEHQKERALYKTTHTTVYPLESGLYFGTFSQLNLQSNDRYTLYFYNILISEGTWGKEGNEIYLYDTNLHHNFYVLVEEETLIGKYLPGSFRDNNILIKGNNFDRYFNNQNDLFIDGRSISIKEPQGEPFMFVDQMPEFPQGDKALEKYLKNNLRYPDAAKKAGIKGKIHVRFVIERDGSIGTVTIVKSLSPECDAEAIRLVKSMPKWKAGKLNGKEAAVWYAVRVEFGE